MATASIDGLLKSNIDIRNNNLSKWNNGKYFLYPDKLSPGIGEESTISVRNINSLTDNKGLLGYTLYGNSDYSDYINDTYFRGVKDKNIFINNNQVEPIQPWRTEGKDYIQYLDEIFGEDAVMFHVNLINGLLATKFVENNLRLNEIGVVRDFIVNAAMGGAVTTNVSNFSGTDTKLGLITNQMYSHSLYYGANFNSTRMNSILHFGDHNIPKSYITPSLYNQYGNNSSTVFRLSEILRLNDGEQFVREDLGGDVHFNDIENNSGIQYLAIQISDSEKYLQSKGFTNKHYTFEEGNQYYDGVLDLKTGKYISNVDFGFNDINKDINKSLTTIPIYGVYKDTDNAGYPYKQANVAYKTDSDDVSYNDIEEKYEVIKSNNENSLISKTNSLFEQGKIDTMIGRFYLSKDNNNVEFIDTAKTGKFGNSKGRNLLKLDAKMSDENPYCRTWNYRHQYNQIKNLIRPFTNEEDSFYTLEEVQRMTMKYRSYINTSEDFDFNSEDRHKGALIDGASKLGKNSVLQNNGFVRITPYHTDKDGNGNFIKGIKDCMFSLENLAWKDYTITKQGDNLVTAGGRVISKEQIGPNGGRIMWFPPYDLDFQESVDVDWNENTFIGRGERVYTYKNTTRTGTLSFTLLIDHPSIINKYVNACGDGMGEDKDPHADLLRFFAGCNVLSSELKEENELEGITPIPPEIEYETKTLNIKIHFPNCFCGVYGKDTFEFDRFTNRNFTDDENINDYWWRYLLIGNTTVIPNGSDIPYIGYEMRPDYVNFGSETGITLTQNTGFDPEKVEISGETIDLRVESCTGQNIGVLDCNGNGDFFYYYPDEDMRDKLEINNYKDLTNFKLNSIIEGERNEGEYTFAELILSILEFSGNTNKDEYFNYCVNECGVDEEKIKELYNILSNDKIEFTYIKVIGSADENGKPEENNLLTERRAYVVKDLLKRTILKGNDLGNNFVVEDGDVAGAKGESVSSKTNKIARCADLTITYKVPKIENVSDADTTQASEEKLEGKLTYEEFKQCLIDNSDIIKVYSETNGFDLDNVITLSEMWKENEYEKDNWLGSNKDFAKINEVINKIIEIGGVDWIKLAYAMSVDGSYDEFIALVKGMMGTSGNMNDDDPKVKELKQESDKLKKEYDDAEEEIKKCDDEIKHIKELQEKAISSIPEDIEEEDSMSQSDMNNLLKTVSDYEKDISNLLKKKGDLVDKKNKAKSKYDEKYDEYLTALMETAQKSDKNDEILKDIEEAKQNKKLCEDVFALLKETEINIRNQKNKENKDLETLESEYETSLDAYKKAISNNDNSKKEVRKLTKEVKKTGDKYYELLNEINKDTNIIYSAGDKGINGPITITLSFNNEVEDFIPDVLKTLINDKEEKYEYNDKKYTAADLLKELFGGINKVCIYSLYKKINELIDEIEQKQTDLKENEQRNDLNSGDTLSFMYIFGETIQGNEADDAFNTVFNSTFNLSPTKYDDEGNEIEHSETITNLAFYPLFNYYLFIDYVTDTYKETYGDDLYLFFKVVYDNINSGDDYVEELDLYLNLYRMYYSGLTCCPPDYGDIKKGEVMSKADDALGAIQQGFEKIYIPEVERLIKERKEQEEEAAKAAAAQKLIEDNLREQRRRREEEEIEKEKRKYKDYKNEMLKWGEYDVSKYNNRYETEAEYFNNLSENDPFTYKNLKEKFKYFNPAFHSITPEGFNARLTFLQQCTRQGATIEVNNTSSGSDGIISPDALAKTAANLAFGRMPVCVLRIGDFIHTKVIIKSMSINYGSNGAMQWDLNPEGIGVQPMYAKVSMNIAIIGGQSLETPINRLQNALSFNYYANAEVYDNRADSAIYKNRDIEYKYVFDPTNQEESNWGEKGDLLGGGNMVPAIDDPNIKTNDESLRRREQENSGDNLDKNSGQDLDSTKDNWLFSKDKFSTILTYEGEIVYNSSVNVIPSGKFNIKYMNEPQIIISYVKDDISLTIKDVTLKDCKFEAIPGKNIDGNEYTHKEAILKLDENIENYRQYLLDYYKNGEETETINKDIYSFKCKDVITNLINKDSSEINKTLIKNNIDYVVILDSGHHENISGKFSPVFTEEDLLDDDVLTLIEDVDLLKECSDIQDDGESYRFREYKYVKKLIESIKKEIEKDNEIKVELTHIDNTLSDATKDVAHRVDYVNNTIIGDNKELKKYLLVSVHCNAADNGEQWQTVNGWKIYTSPKYDSVGENKELYYKSSVEMCENTVKIFNEEIFVGNPIKAKPVETKLKLMCETKCPSVLTENFFMDSKSGLVCLINYYDNLRDLHVNSIKEYFCS